jgi:hypothetical protein
MRGRYAEVWFDAIGAEHASLGKDSVERHYRRMLALTDEVLGRLERRNLAGQRALDEVMRRDLARTLDALPPRARARFHHTAVVQEALDGMFEVQVELMGVLQRMLHWSRVLSTDAYDGEDATDGRPQARRTA